MARCVRYLLYLAQQNRIAQIKQLRSMMKTAQVALKRNKKPYDKRQKPNRINAPWTLIDHDKNQTGLSPYGITVIYCFVFMSDQVCSQDYLAVTESIIGTYFSHGFGLYSCLFGVFPRVQWFPKLYTHVPILWNTSTA